MKKILILCLCTFMILGLSGCEKAEEPTPEAIRFVDDTEINNMYSNPEMYQGMYVTLKGKVFTQPQESNGLAAFQMWGDPDHNDKNTLITCDKALLNDINTDDYITVIGYVAGQYEGNNALGGNVKAPQIVAETIEKSSYIEAISPAINTIEINGTSTQYDVDITITKVEFAQKETRVYLSVNNRSNEKFHIYQFNSKLTQNNKQYEETKNYNAKYPEIDSEILPGIKSEGIIVFPAIQPANFQFLCQGHLDDYTKRFNDFVFNITINN